MVENHTHNGIDTPKLYANDCLEYAPQLPLTTGTSNTAGGTYTTTEQGMINNLKTRVAELELRLQNLGLLK